MAYTINSETIHTVDIENAKGEIATIAIDGSDVNQVGAISKIFEGFRNLKDNQTEIDVENLDSIIAATSVISEHFIKIEALIDLAFGSGSASKMFLGSHSIIVYEKFLEMLDEELQKAGVKVENHYKKVREKYAPQDHKKGKGI